MIASFGCTAEVAGAYARHVVDSASSLQVKRNINVLDAYLCFPFGSKILSIKNTKRKDHNLN